MRKVTNDAVTAFMSGKKGNFNNTSVSVEGEYVVLRLHGNAIARYREGFPSTVEVCDGGYQSRTTKERLNGIPGVHVYQRAGQWYLNDEVWDGYWTEVAI